MAKLEIVFSMLIFGTIGIVVSHIPLPSSVIALAHSGIGALFLVALLLSSKRKPNWRAVRKNLPLLLISGAALGFNWILLFEAYRLTTVATATVCYYTAPVFIILLSPVVLKERLTPLKLVCAAAAFAGVVLISETGGGSTRGVLFGLSAAVLYCAIVLINKRIRGLPPVETTLFQLVFSAAVMLPYTSLTEDLSAIHPAGSILLLLLIAGIVHTGVAYFLYFESLKKLPAQTAAVFSYIDPVTAILLSAAVLHQPMTTRQIFGAVLILGASLLSDLWPQRRTSDLKPKKGKL